MERGIEKILKRVNFFIGVWDLGPEGMEKVS